MYRSTLGASIHPIIRHPDLAIEQPAYYVMENDLERKAVPVIKDFCTSQKSAPASMWI
jgi:hypothetical protein